jgi:catechol 2,3-dioxygenase-like lactoylglutathione lyase family enzyme
MALSGGVQLPVSLEGGAGGTTSKRHVCFLVEDLGDVRQELAQAGCDIEPGETESYGLRRFFVRDPAGNKLEIGELPGHQHQDDAACN